MRRLVLLAALFALQCAPAASMPDMVTKDGVTYARRGSLGANSYVVTNVVVEPPSYRLSRVAEAKLRDRCVNSATVEGPGAVFALPGRRTTAGCARSVILCLYAANEGGCSVEFAGADALYTTNWGDAPRVERGRYVFSIMEIDDNRYLIDVREMHEIGGQWQ